MRLINDVGKQIGVPFRLVHFQPQLNPPQGYSGNVPVNALMPYLLPVATLPSLNISIYISLVAISRNYFFVLE